MVKDGANYLKKRYKKSLLSNKLYSFKSRIFKPDKSKPRSKKYAGRLCRGVDDGAKIIFDGLSSDKPFMACRFGSVELNTFTDGLRAEFGDGKAFEADLVNGTVYSNAGFFPKGDKELLKRFVDEYKVVTSAADFIGVWYNPLEDYVIERFGSDGVQVGVLRAIEPWYSSFKWTAALKGKKVLVIHPFAETIKSQYEKREKLFSDGTLPEFKLRTIKAVQTIAGERDERFKDWFAALDYMYNAAINIDFDIALIGCGAYGAPLAARLKAAGKKTVHMGGALQLLFGIKGKRWDDHPVISKLYNENWTRPSGGETPSRAASIENGCYW